MIFKKVVFLTELTLEEKLILIGLIMCLMFYGFAYLTTYLGLLIMLIALIIVSKNNGFWKVIDTPLTKPLIALIIVAIISLINVNDFREAGNKLGNILEMLIPFFASYYIFKDKPARFNKILASISIIGAISIAIFGIYQYHFLGINRVTSLLNNANLLGAYLLLLLPISLCFINEKGLRYKLLSIFPFVLISASLFYSGSRSAFLGALISIIIFAILRFRDTRKIIVFLLIISLVIPIVTPESLMNRIEETYERFSEGRAQRIYIWQNAYEMLKANPLLGAGIGQYGVNYKIYAEAPIQYRKFSHAHNIFLHISSELGLLGISIFIWLILIILKLTYNYLPIKDTFNETLSIALFSSFAGFFVQEQFEFSLINAGGIIILTGILLGWYIALISSFEDKRT